MKKYFLLFILSIICLLNVHAADLNTINSQNALVINLNDNSILYSKNIDEKIEIASLTKIMTCLVAIEKIDDFNKTVTITEPMLEDIFEYSKAGLKVGDTVTLEDLLYGIMLPSGADAVQAVAITLAGSNESFAELMNERAKSLNLSNTHFSNGIGKDEDNYSTVSDVSKILIEALKNPKFYKIYTTKSYTMTNGLELTSTISTHKLDTSLIKGSKTGFTDAAGLCITAFYEDDTYKYLVVTAKANFTEGKPYHILDALTFIQYYLENYHYIDLYKKGDTLTSIPVINSLKDKYDILSKETIKLYVPTNITPENLNIKINTIDNISNNLKKGSYLGNIKVSNNENELYYEDFTLDEDIKYKNNSDKPIIILLIIAMVLLMIYNILLRCKIHRIINSLKSKKNNKIT